MKTWAQICKHLQAFYIGCLKTQKQRRALDKSGRVQDSTGRAQHPQKYASLSMSSAGCCVIRRRNRRRRNPIRNGAAITRAAASCSVDRTNCAFTWCRTPTSDLSRSVLLRPLTRLASVGNSQNFTTFFTPRSLPCVRAPSSIIYCWRISRGIVTQDNSMIYYITIILTGYSRQ